MLFLRCASPATRALGAMATVALLSSEPSAHAFDKPLSTGIVQVYGSTGVTTICSVVNLGTRPVTIVSAANFASANGAMTAPTSDNCSTTRLLALGGCFFSERSGSLGVGGGMVLVRDGNAKRLRGICRLLDASGNTLETLEMN